MPTTNYCLRPFTPADYPAMLLLGRLAFGDEVPMDLETLRRRDEACDPATRRGRILAARIHGEGEVLGMAPWIQQQGGSISFWIAVRPEERRQGIGGALYAAVLEAVTPFDPPALQTSAREDMHDSVAFLQRRGFTETMRSSASRLELADFRRERFAGAEEAVAARGIAIRTFAEIDREPGARERVYAVEQTLWQDVPSTEPYVPLSFEAWERQVVQDPHFLPDAYFVAVDAASGAFVGGCTLARVLGSDDLQNRLTGVRRDYRRRGIALALKVRAARFAQESGIPSLRTGNASSNAAMLAINERLGFQSQLVRIRYARQLRRSHEERT